MTGAKHTPGPWGIAAVHVNTEDGVSGAVIGQMERPPGVAGLADAFVVCVVPLVGDESPWNVSMICASPMMFTALQMVQRSGTLSAAMAAHVNAVLELATVNTLGRDEKQ